MKSAADKKRFIRKALSHDAHFAARFGATYFITICCRERHRNQLCNRDVAQVIFETAARYDCDANWYLQLLLLMPDHLHALISINGDQSLAKTIGNFKRATNKFAGVIWQRNFFDHRLRDDGGPIGKESYIRQNPVRAGLVTNADDWPYVMDRANLDVAVH